MKSTIHPKIKNALLRIYPDVKGRPGKLSYMQMPISDAEKLKNARQWFKGEIAEAKRNLKYAQDMLVLCK